MDYKKIGVDDILILNGCILSQKNINELMDNKNIKWWELSEPQHTHQKKYYLFIISIFNETRHIKIYPSDA